MRKSLFTLLFIFFWQTLLSQFSFGLNGGVGSTRRDLLNGRAQTISCAGLALDIEYKFDSIPIVLNLSPYLITQSRFEQVVLYNLITSIYEPKAVIMCGLGIYTSASNLIHLYASVQFGYWYTENRTYIYPENDKIYRNLNQFSIGPKVKLAIGKRKLKTILVYEDHLLSPTYKQSSIFERFTRISLGLSYSFK